MLQNEETKLQSLYQAAYAAERTDAERGRELTIAGHGEFSARFKPHP